MHVEVMQPNEQACPCAVQHRVVYITMLVVVSRLTVYLKLCEHRHR